uniref:SON DNA binding protein n=1 Tax=Ficedula albicollis TaxID=59894 RepID=A0A803V9L6_FICAL
MATNIEQILRSFVVSKFREIQEEQQQQHGGAKVEGQPNGDTIPAEQAGPSEASGAAGSCQSEQIVQKIEEVLSGALGTELQCNPDVDKNTVKNSTQSTKRSSTGEDEIPRKKAKKNKKHKSKKKKKKKKKRKKEKKHKKQPKESKLSARPGEPAGVQPAPHLMPEQPSSQLNVQHGVFADANLAGQVQPELCSKPTEGLDSQALGLVSHSVTDSQQSAENLGSGEGTLCATNPPFNLESIQSNIPENTSIAQTRICTSEEQIQQSHENIYPVAVNASVVDTGNYTWSSMPSGIVSKSEIQKDSAEALRGTEVTLTSQGTGEVKTLDAALEPETMEVLTYSEASHQSVSQGAAQGLETASESVSLASGVTTTPAPANWAHPSAVTVAHVAVAGQEVKIPETTEKSLHVGNVGSVERSSELEGVSRTLEPSLQPSVISGSLSMTQGSPVEASRVLKAGVPLQHPLTISAATPVTHVEIKSAKTPPGPGAVTKMKDMEPAMGQVEALEATMEPVAKHVRAAHESLQGKGVEGTTGPAAALGASGVFLQHGVLTETRRADRAQGSALPAGLTGVNVVAEAKGLRATSEPAAVVQTLVPQTAPEVQMAEGFRSPQAKDSECTSLLRESRPGDESHVRDLVPALSLQKENTQGAGGVLRPAAVVEAKTFTTASVSLQVEGVQTSEEMHCGTVASPGLPALERTPEPVVARESVEPVREAVASAGGMPWQATAETEPLHVSQTESSIIAQSQVTTHTRTSQTEVLRERKDSEHAPEAETWNREAILEPVQTSETGSKSIQEQIVGHSAAVLESLPRVEENSMTSGVLTELTDVQTQGSAVEHEIAERRTSTQSNEPSEMEKAKYLEPASEAGGVKWLESAGTSEELEVPMGDASAAVPEYLHAEKQQELQVVQEAKPAAEWKSAEEAPEILGASETKSSEAVPEPGDVKGLETTLEHEVTAEVQYVEGVQSQQVEDMVIDKEDAEQTQTSEPLVAGTVFSSSHAVEEEVSAGTLVAETQDLEAAPQTEVELKDAEAAVGLEAETKDSEAAPVPETDAEAGPELIEEGQLEDTPEAEDVKEATPEEDSEKRDSETSDVQPDVAARMKETLMRLENVVEKSSHRTSEKKHDSKKQKRSRSKSQSRSRKRKKKSRSRSTSRRLASKRARSRSRNYSVSRKKHSKSRSRSVEKRERRVSSRRSRRRRSRSSDRYRSKSRSAEKRLSRRRRSRSSDHYRSKSRSVEKRLSSRRSRRRRSRSSDRYRSKSRSVEKRLSSRRSGRRRSRSSDRYRSKSRSAEKRLSSRRSGRRRSRSSDRYRSKSRSAEKRLSSRRSGRRRSRSSDRYRSKSRSAEKRLSSRRSGRRRSRSSDRYRSKSRSAEKRLSSRRSGRRRSRSSDRYRSKSRSAEKRLSSRRSGRRRSRSSDRYRSKSRSAEKRLSSRRSGRRRSRSSDRYRSKSRSAEKRLSSRRSGRRRSRSSDRYRSKSRSAEKRLSSRRSGRRRSRSSDRYRSKSRSVEKRLSSRRSGRRRSRSSDRYRSKSRSVEKRLSSWRSRRRHSRSSDRSKSRSRSSEKGGGKEYSWRFRHRSGSSDRSKSRSRSVEKRGRKASVRRSKRQRSKSSDRYKSRSRSVEKRKQSSRKSKRQRSKSSDRYKSRSKSVEKKKESSRKSKRRRSKSSERYKSRSRSVEKKRKESSKKSKRKRSKSSDSVKSRSKSVEKKDKLSSSKSSSKHVESSELQESAKGLDQDVPQSSFGSEGKSSNGPTSGALSDEGVNGPVLPPSFGGGFSKTSESLEESSSSVEKPADLQHSTTSEFDTSKTPDDQELRSTSMEKTQDSELSTTPDNGSTEKAAALESSALPELPHSTSMSRSSSVERRGDPETSSVAEFHLSTSREDESRPAPLKEVEGPELPPALRDMQVQSSSLPSEGGLSNLSDGHESQRVPGEHTELSQVLQVPERESSQLADSPGAVEAQRPFLPPEMIRPVIPDGCESGQMQEPSLAPDSGHFTSPDGHGSGSSFAPIEEHPLSVGESFKSPHGSEQSFLSVEKVKAPDVSLTSVCGSVEVSADIISVSSYEVHDSRSSVDKALDGPTLPQVLEVDCSRSSDMHESRYLTGKIDGAGSLVMSKSGIPICHDGHKAKYNSFEQTESAELSVASELRCSIFPEGYKLTSAAIEKVEIQKPSLSLESGFSVSADGCESVGTPEKLQPPVSAVTSEGGILLLPDSHELRPVPAEKAEVLNSSELKHLTSPDGYKLRSAYSEEVQVHEPFLVLENRCSVASDGHELASTPFERAEEPSQVSENEYTVGLDGPELTSTPAEKAELRKLYQMPEESIDSQDLQSPSAEKTQVQQPALVSENEHAVSWVSQELRSSSPEKAEMQEEAVVPDSAVASNDHRLSSFLAEKPEVQECSLLPENEYGETAEDQEVTASPAEKEVQEPSVTPGSEYSIFHQGQILQSGLAESTAVQDNRYAASPGVQQLLRAYTEKPEVQECSLLPENEYSASPERHPLRSSPVEKELEEHSEASESESSISTDSQELQPAVAGKTEVQELSLSEGECPMTPEGQELQSSPAERVTAKEPSLTSEQALSPEEYESRLAHAEKTEGVDSALTAERDHLFFESQEVSFTSLQKADVPDHSPTPENQHGASPDEQDLRFTTVGKVDGLEPSTLNDRASMSPDDSDLKSIPAEKMDHEMPSLMPEGRSVSPDNCSVRSGPGEETGDLEPSLRSERRYSTSSYQEGHEPKSPMEEEGLESSVTSEHRRSVSPEGHDQKSTADEEMDDLERRSTSPDEHESRSSIGEEAEDLEQPLTTEHRSSESSDEHDSRSTTGEEAEDAEASLAAERRDSISSDDRESRSAAGEDVEDGEPSLTAERRHSTSSDDRESRSTADEEAEDLTAEHRSVSPDGRESRSTVGEEAEDQELSLTAERRHSTSSDEQESRSTAGEDAEDVEPSSAAEQRDSTSSDEQESRDRKSVL